VRLPHSSERALPRCRYFGTGATAATPPVGEVASVVLEDFGTGEILSSALLTKRSCVENRRLSYLFTPVVGVSAGVCVAPDFGMTVSFMVVDGIFGI
jgi:hypothetical protein